LGLVPWSLGLQPGKRLILMGDHLFTEHHGTVTVHAAPSGPSLKVLELLATGFQGRDELARHVWGLPQYHPSKHNAVINTALSRLRPSLGAPQWVITHDAGYHLADGVEFITVAASPTATALTPSVPPPPAEELALEGLLREDALSSAEVARALHISPSSALRLLRRLAHEGRVEKMGSGRSTRYRWGNKPHKNFKRD
jgi:hypothetical protein